MSDSCFEGHRSTSSVVDLFLSTCLQVWIYIGKHIYPLVVSVYIHTYLHTCMHTYIHVHTHTNTQANENPFHLPGPLACCQVEPSRQLLQVYTGYSLYGFLDLDRFMTAKIGQLEYGFGVCRHSFHSFSGNEQMLLSHVSLHSLGAAVQEGKA